MLAIIAAFDRNRGIGLNGRIPWRIPGEQRQFRELTSGAAVIMGRRTWQEIGRPLPERRCIVLSGDPDFRAPGCLTARTLDEALALAGDLDAYVSGGASVYAQALALADRLYLTEIDASYPADTFVPVFDESHFIRRLDERVYASVPYTRYIYMRKQSLFCQKGTVFGKRTYDAMEANASDLEGGIANVRFL